MWNGKKDKRALWEENNFRNWLSQIESLLIFKIFYQREGI